MAILGLGQIGRAIARRARAFGIHVIGLNRSNPTRVTRTEL
jgi:phosphoglycerate dehydrogenase-like enzyme